MFLIVLEQINFKRPLLADFKVLPVKILEKTLKELFVVIERSQIKIAVNMKMFRFSLVSQDLLGQILVGAEPVVLVVYENPEKQNKCYRYKDYKSS